MAASKFKVALVQLFVTATKADNLSRATKLIGEAARNGAKLVALPECFNSPYGTSFFPEYAETIPGQSTDVLSKAAKENGVYLVGGSIPEKDGDKLYNTCTVYNPAGDLIAKHRKVHLFDIDIPGKIRFQESEVLTAGNSLTMVETPFCKLGIGICYDVRFAEMAQIYTKNGCNFLLYPGAFNMTTGPAHWEMLAKARAIDNQCYVGMVAPARDEKASYVAWGHSLLVDPWGTVMETAEADEKIVYSDIDLAYISQVRQQVPISFQKRTDLYSIKNIVYSKLPRHRTPSSKP